MHPTTSSKEALQGMIRIIKNKGMSIGTVSELLSSKRVAEAGSNRELIDESAAKVESLAHFC